MAATVTVRAKAFGDSRIVYLGKLLGCTWNDAFVRMIRLWSVCAEQQNDRPEVRFIRACLEHPEGELQLIESGLGDDKHRDPTLDAGVVRVRGCDETDWHCARIEQGARAEAGRIRAALADRDAGGRYRSGAPPGIGPADGPADHQHRSSSGPASDHSPDLISDLPDSLRPELPDPREILVAERGFSRSRQDRRRKLFGDAWAYAGLKHEELKRDGFDAHARNCWVAMPDASSLEARSLFDRIDELTVGDTADWTSAAEIMRNRVDVAVAEARRDRTLRWFIPARMWDVRSFAIAKDLSPEQAAQPKTPPRPTPAAAAEPMRRIKTL